MFKKMTGSMIVTAFFSLPAFGDTYDCVVHTVSQHLHETQEETSIAHFTINTAQQDNADTSNNGVNSGCIVIRSNPERLSCYISGINEKPISAIAIADVGSTVVAVAGFVKDVHYQTTCTRK